MKKIRVGADTGYVRRTAEQFAAGAKPARDGSHRYTKSILLTMTPEMEAAIKLMAERQGIPARNWLRGVAKHALANGINASEALGSEAEFEVPDDFEGGPSQEIPITSLRPLRKQGEAI